MLSHYFAYLNNIVLLATAIGLLIQGCRYLIKGYRNLSIWRAKFTDWRARSSGTRWVHITGWLLRMAQTILFKGRDAHCENPWWAVSLEVGCALIFGGAAYASMIGKIVGWGAASIMTSALLLAILAQVIAHPRTSDMVPNCIYSLARAVAYSVMLCAMDHRVNLARHIGLFSQLSCAILIDLALIPLIAEIDVSRLPSTYRRF